MSAHDQGAPGDSSDTTVPASSDPDERASTIDPSLTELDKTLADSFPSSDPPAMP